MLGRIIARTKSVTLSTKLRPQHNPLEVPSSLSIRMNFSSRGPTGSGASSGAGDTGASPSTSELRALISMMEGGISPRVLLNHLAPTFHIPPGADDMMLWRLLVSMIGEPPKRRELSQYKTIEDAVELIKKSCKILVLSGAGISTSAGLPDFRSRNGIYVQINAEHPDLQDPKSMFDIEYFRENPMPFYQFAKALYPGQYKPTIGHKFIKCIEDHQKLLRNYSQNIDTLEKQTGIKRVVECHGSFARATCTNCKYNVDGDDIRADIMNQRIPYCPRCQALEDGPQDGLGVMKPNIVFFGEQLGDEFHNSIETDKEQADLLIVIGSSLKVKPVALIPKCVPPEIPQILINKEPLDHMGFDIELLGNCDDIIQELCLRLGQGWTDICETRKTRLTPFVGLPTNTTTAVTTTTTTTTTDTGPTAITKKPQPSNEIMKLGNEFKDNAVASGSRDMQEDATSAVVEETDIDDAASFKSNQATAASESGDTHLSEDAAINDDDDDDDDWEDIEIISSSQGARSSGVANPKAKADLHIPDSSYIYLKPKTYLFPGAELTNSQLSHYTKDHSDSMNLEASDTSEQN